MGVDGGGELLYVLCGFMGNFWRNSGRYRRPEENLGRCYGHAAALTDDNRP